MIHSRLKSWDGVAGDVSGDHVKDPIIYRVSPPGICETPVNNGINYQPQLVSQISEPINRESF